MRTLQVVNVRWYNATAWYGVYLAKALNDAGHPSVVVGLEDTEPLRQARKLGLEAIALPLNSPSRLPFLLHSMDGLVRDFKPDVINCHRGESFILWAMLKARGQYALIRTRGDARPPKGGLINRLLHTRGADAVIASNSSTARLFLERLGVPSDRLYTIYGGVDTSRFYPNPDARRRVRSELGLTDNDCVLGLVGRLDKVKGVEESIMALGRLAAARRIQGKNGSLPRLLLVAFPSQYDESDVSRWTAQAGLGALGEHVILTGRTDRPEDFMNAFDLGIVASLGSEAVARAALEIMACGVPLVSSRVGVMPDLLPAPYLFAPGDVDGMTALLAQAMGEESEEAGAAWRAALGQLCLKRVLCPASDVPCSHSLTLEGFRDQTLAVYDSALSRCRC